MNGNPLKPEGKPGGEQVRRGNRARIDPARPVTGQNITNPVTQAAEPRRPGQSAENAARARDFSRENKQ